MNRFFLLFVFVLSLSISQNWYKVEPNHSTIGFAISIAGFTKVTGKFSNFLVYIDFDTVKLEPRAIEAAIETKTIDTGIDSRDHDLMGQTFFSVVKYPKITFKSKSIKKNGNTWIAFGEFTMKGVSKEIELPFEFIAKRKNNSSKYTLGFVIRSSLNRLDYNIANDWKHTIIPNFLGNEIALEFDMWARPIKEKKKEIL